MDYGLMREGTRILHPGRVLRLRDAAGRHLDVLRGTVWITQFGDSRDPVIEAGGSFRFDRDGVALVQALGEDAVVVLEAGLASDGERSGEQQPRREIDYPALLSEALHLRGQAMDAFAAAAAARLRAAWRAARAWIARGFSGAPRGTGTTRELARLNDHLLRDLGLARDRLPLAGRAAPCTYC